MTIERHIRDSRLIAYGQNDLDASDRDEIEAHLRRCDRCRVAAKEYRTIFASVSECITDTVSIEEPRPLERAISLRRAEIDSHARGRAPFGRSLGKAVKMRNAVNDEMAGGAIALAPAKRWTRGWVAAFAAVVLLGALSGAWFSQEKLHPKDAAQSSIDETRRHDAMIATSLNNLKNLAISVARYADANHGVLPPMKTPEEAKDALIPYLGTDEYFIDPATNAPYLPNPALSMTMLDQYAGKSSMIIAFYEGTPKTDGTRFVVFLDGLARRLTEEEWQDAKRLSAIMDVTTDTTNNDFGFH